MTFVNDRACASARYLDLDRCILLGPDAALIPSAGSREMGSYSCSAGSGAEGWLLELYADDEEPVRVLIAGEDE